MAGKRRRSGRRHSALLGGAGSAALRRAGRGRGGAGRGGSFRGGGGGGSGQRPGRAPACRGVPRRPAVGSMSVAGLKKQFYKASQVRAPGIGYSSRRPRSGAGRPLLIRRPLLSLGDLPSLPRRCRLSGTARWYPPLSSPRYPGPVPVCIRRSSPPGTPARWPLANVRCFPRPPVSQSPPSLPAPGSPGAPQHPFFPSPRWLLAIPGLGVSFPPPPPWRGRASPAWAVSGAGCRSVLAVAPSDAPQTLRGSWGVPGTVLYPPPGRGCWRDPSRKMHPLWTRGSWSLGAGRGQGPGGCHGGGVLPTFPKNGPCPRHGEGTDPACSAPDPHRLCGRWR